MIFVIILKFLIEAITEKKDPEGTINVVRNVRPIRLGVRVDEY